MRILITGGRGMLGRTLQEELRDHELMIADLPECDITDPSGLEEFIMCFSPDVVLHCAAMTAVDKCESEVDRAFQLNAFGSANVASSCFRNGIRLIAFSTDYVFGGELDRPYHEFDAAGGAHTVYGQSKFAGEEMIRRHCPNHVICRISWLYGAGGPSFVHAMMQLAAGGHSELKVVDDQRGNPTSTTAVARHLRLILERPQLVGTFHLTCEGEASWFEFAKEIFRLAGKAQNVVPCTTAEFPRPAPRPANSRLEKRMLRLAGLPAMPDWHEALDEFIRREFPAI